MKKINKNLELIPIVALVLFIIVILVFSVVSAGKKREEQAASESVVQESSEDSQTAVVETESGSDIYDGTDGDDYLVTSQTVEVVLESAGAQGAAAGIVPDEVESQETGVSGNSANQSNEALTVQGDLKTGSSVPGSVSANEVKKTNGEMLAEMMDYWSRGNIEAVKELGRLPRYREMSGSLSSARNFYYYGDRNDQGNPQGQGIAVYGENQYYYGSWTDGIRHGKGTWIKLHIYEDKDTVSDRVINNHSYEGEWKNNLPGGEGQEHFDLDIKKATGQKRYYENVIGNFTDGLYDGDMYITTVNYDTNRQEWKGTARAGVWDTYKGKDTQGRVPVCADVQNPDSHMWIDPLKNIYCGITEVRKQLEKQIAGSR